MADETTKLSEQDGAEEKEISPEPVADTTPEKAPQEEQKPEAAEAAPAEESVVDKASIEEAPAEEMPVEQPTEKIPELPNIRPGMTVRVHQKIRETNAKGEEKERIQLYEGIVIAKKHGNGQNATITVRKVSGGIGVEKIFPIHSPNIAKIEPIKQARIRRAKLYFLRDWKKRLKETFIKEK